jgi:hypothetical protein
MGGELAKQGESKECVPSNEHSGEGEARLPKEGAEPEAVAGTSDRR